MDADYVVHVYYINDMLQWLLLSVSIPCIQFHKYIVIKITINPIMLRHLFMLA